MYVCTTVHACMYRHIHGMSTNFDCISKRACTSKHVLSNMRLAGSARFDVTQRAPVRNHRLTHAHTCTHACTDASYMPTLVNENDMKTSEQRILSGIIVTAVDKTLVVAGTNGKDDLRPHVC